MSSQILSDFLKLNELFLKLSFDIREWFLIFSGWTDILDLLSLEVTHFLLEFHCPVYQLFVILEYLVWWLEDLVGDWLEGVLFVEIELRKNLLAFVEDLGSVEGSVLAEELFWDVLGQFLFDFLEVGHVADQLLVWEGWDGLEGALFDDLLFEHLDVSVEELELLGWDFWWLGWHDETVVSIDVRWPVVWLGDCFEERDLWKRLGKSR